MAPPVARLLITQAYLLSGGVMYAHGGSMNLLFLTLVWGFAAAVWELVAVPAAIWHLKAHPESRTRQNILAVAAAGVYIISAVVLWLVLP
jgi:hypothetical protein